MFIVIAVLIVIVSIVAARQVDVKTTTQEEQEVMGEAVESPTSTLTPSPSPSQTPKPSSSSTSNSSVSIKQDIKDNSTNGQNFNLSDFRYPISTQIDSSQNSLKLESTDDPKNITEWYKEKITSLDFKTKSFVQTNTNDHVLNKLVGVSGNIQIKVDIEKQPDANKTIISVTLTAS